MTKSITDKILIIADHRLGTYQQSIALAEAIGINYELIKVNYNYLSILPNFLLQYFPIHLDKKSSYLIKDFILNSNYTPKLIITAGRRTASIALKLKKKFPNTQLIQIMQPGIDYKKFDFVILPNHDKIQNKQFKNLITTTGALTRVNEKLIKIEQQKFVDFFKKIDKKIIILLIGGNSKDSSYNPISIKNLCQQISTIANNMNCFLVVFNSPRTDLEINQIISQNLNCDHVFYEFKKIKDNNPYIASLGWGSYFVVTGDSVSMISECCSTGKPVFIFDEKKISSAKHRIFHQQLFKNNYAVPFSNTLTFFSKNSSPKLQEAKRISSLIRNKF
jgi:mitochondrial fission protein ELM1